MSTSRAGSSGGGYERIQKRSNTGGNTTPAAPSSSSSSSAYAYPPPPRSDSPPASAYFPLLAADRDSDSARLRPIPDAESHFAYSTTLRRHHPEGHHTADIAQVVNAEAVSLWSRVVSHITGQPISSRDEDDFPHGRVDPKRDTASARFAHCSAEVRVNIALSLELLFTKSSSYRTRYLTFERQLRMDCSNPKSRLYYRDTGTTNLPCLLQNHCTSSSQKPFTKVL